MVSIVGDVIFGLTAYTHSYIVGLIGIILLLMGYVGVEQTCVSWIKNLFPTNAYGQYEGIRMIFYVAVPMVVGSSLANFLINTFGAKIGDGVVVNETVFYIVAALSVVIIIPSYLADKYVKKQSKKEN